MSITDTRDDEFTPTAPFGRSWRGRRGGKVLIDDSPAMGPTKNPAKLPDSPIAPDPITDPMGERRDQFSALYPQEIDHETRNVRLDITFAEPIRIRDQAEMVKAAMDEIIAITKKHDLGSISQRRMARHAAAVLGRALSRFNGKTPYGEYRKKPK